MVSFPDVSETELIITLLIIVIILNLVGFLLYIDSYIPNFVAEVSGVFTGILIGLILVNRFNRIQKRRQWKKVEVLTLESLMIYLEEFFLEVFTNFNYPGMDLSPITPMWKDIDQELVNALDEWIDDLNKNKDRIIDPKKEIIGDRVVEWYDATNDSLLVIRNVLFPRVLEISEDKELIDSLIDFDSNMMELYIKIKGYKETYAYDLFPIFIDVLKKIQKILNVIAIRKSNLYKLKRINKDK